MAYWDKSKRCFCDLQGIKVDILTNDHYFGFLTQQQRVEIKDILDNDDERCDFLIRKIEGCSGDFWNDHRNMSVSDLISFYQKYEEEHY